MRRTKRNGIMVEVGWQSLELDIAFTMLALIMYYRRTKSSGSCILTIHARSSTAGTAAYWPLVTARMHDGN
jgi:hypothetical protein